MSLFLLNEINEDGVGDVEEGP